MKFPKFSKSAKLEDWKEFLQNVRRQLDDKTYNRQDSTKAFMTDHELNMIWTPETLLLFIEGLRHFDTNFKARKPDDVYDCILQRKLSKTISILILIGWDGWKTFTEIFCKDGHGRFDGSLPHTFADLEKDSFLGNGPFARSFEREQHAYLPTIIEDNTFHHSYDSKKLLPFILPDEQNEIGSGASGKVSKEIIAPFQRKRVDGSFYSKESVVAIKRLREPMDFKKERKILEDLSASAGSHKHILEFKAIFTHGNEHGRQLCIAMDFAEGHLQDLLDGKLNGATINMGPCSLKSLMYAASGIVDAIRNLHNGLQIRDEILYCCHMDLKPENILIFPEKDKHGEWISPGVWKISDFGISSLHSPVDEPIYDPKETLRLRFCSSSKGDRRTLNIKAAREPGEYSAPELFESSRVGRSSDIWSLGCILFQVLVRGVGGEELLERLTEERFQPDSNTDYFYTKPRRILNPCVETWLQEPIDIDHFPRMNAELVRLWAKSIQDCKRLIHNMLCIEPQARMKAQQIGIALSNAVRRLPDRILLHPQGSLSRQDLVLRPSLDSLSTSSLISFQPIEPITPFGSCSSWSTGVDVGTGDNNSRGVNAKQDLDSQRGTKKSIISSAASTIIRISEDEVQIQCLRGPLTSKPIYSKPEGGQSSKWNSGNFAGDYLLLSGSEEGNQHVLKLKKLEQGSESAIEIKPQPLPGKIPPFQLHTVSKDGRILLAGTEHYTIYIYDPVNPVFEKVPIKPQPDPKERMRSLWFSTDGKWAFAWSTLTGGDHYVRSWSVLDPDKMRCIILRIPDSQKTSNNIQRIVHFPNSQRIVVWRKRGHFSIHGFQKDQCNIKVDPLATQVKDPKALVVTPNEDAIVVIAKSSEVHVLSIVENKAFGSINSSGASTPTSVSGRGSTEPISVSWSLKHKRSDPFDHKIRDGNKCDVVIEEQTSSESEVKLLIACNDVNRLGEKRLQI